MTLSRMLAETIAHLETGSQSYEAYISEIESILQLILDKAKKEGYVLAHKEGVLSATLDWKAKTKAAYEEGFKAGHLCEENKAEIVKAVFLDAAKIADTVHEFLDDEICCAKSIAAKLRAKANDSSEAGG